MNIKVTNMTRDNEGIKVSGEFRCVDDDGRPTYKMLTFPVSERIGHHIKRELSREAELSKI